MSKEEKERILKSIARKNVETMHEIEMHFTAISGALERLKYDRNHLDTAMLLHEAEELHRAVIRMEDRQAIADVLE